MGDPRTTVPRWPWAWALAASLGCASAADIDQNQPFEIGDSSPTTGGMSSVGDDFPGTKGDNPEDDGNSLDGDSGDDGVPLPPPDLGPCDDDADCMLAADFCWQSQGQCIGGTCEHGPEPAGVLCDDGDPCTSDDVCDGAGGCGGTVLSCSFDHATGGSCNGGVCEGMACDAGFGNCDGGWENGCETPLNTNSNCGGCGDTCTVGAHATASCSTGVCEAMCDSPWEDCDENPSNGCEIPVGVPNQCDATGLNAVTGCWTAHCGSSGDAEAVNFGDWYCYECTTCMSPSTGQCQWCSHDTGTWYPADTCACGGFENLTCG